MPDRPISFTVYPSVKAVKRGRVESLPWPEWAKRFAVHARRKEKDGPCAVLGRIPDGAGRAKNLVESVDALALDVEHRSEAEVSALLDRLAPFEFALWSTHSHAEAAPRLRIVLPLARSLKPSEHAEAWRRLQHLAGGANDEATKDVARVHYLPSCPPGADPLFLRNPGADLDPLSLPASPPSSAARERPAPAPLSDVERLVLRDKMRHRLRSIARGSEMRRSAEALAKGEDLAPEKERHQAILALTKFLADAYPDAPSDAVVELFAPSLAATPGTRETDDDVRRAFEGWAETVRASREKRRPPMEEAEPYSPEDIARLAARQGWEPADLARRWIVQVDTTFFLLREDGTYSRGYSYHEARPAAARILARAPVRLNEPTANGFRRRPIAELVEDYGVQAHRLVSDLSAQATTYDPVSGALREAVCPLRAVEPREDADVDRWLRALGGDDAEALLDWVAAAPRLDRANSALYLAGSANAGKSLLPTGLARLWTEGSPSRLDSMIGRHNEGLAVCPLVLVDEALKSKHDGQPMSAVLRTAIAETRRPLSRKYKAEASLVGAIRLVLTSNNSFLLQDDEAHGAQDRAAIAQRFLYVQVAPAAARVLESIRAAGVDIQRDWVDGDRIAGHALWLHRTRALRSDGRFLVQGQETEMHRQLATGGSAWNRWVCEWLVRYLDEPSRQDAKRDGLVRAGNGELLVNVMAVVGGWDLYASVAHKDPDMGRVGEALAAISKKKIQRRWDGKQYWYHLVDHEHLVDWSNRHGVGDAGRIRDMVARKLDFRDGIGAVPDRPRPFARLDKKGQGPT